MKGLPVEEPQDKFLDRETWVCIIVGGAIGLLAGIGSAQWWLVWFLDWIAQ